jgi:hypothetical protein
MATALDLLSTKFSSNYFEQAYDILSRQMHIYTPKNVLSNNGMPLKFYYSYSVQIFFITPY